MGGLKKKIRSQKVTISTYKKKSEKFEEFQRLKLIEKTTGKVSEMRKVLGVESEENMHQLIERLGKGIHNELALEDFGKRKGKRSASKQAPIPEYKVENFQKYEYGLEDDEFLIEI